MKLQMDEGRTKGSGQLFKTSLEKALFSSPAVLSVRAIVKLTFFTYRDHYIKLEELPGGTGYVDMAFIPKRYDPSPALIGLSSSNFSWQSCKISAKES